MGPDRTCCGKEKERIFKEPRERKFYHLSHRPAFQSLAIQEKQAQQRKKGMLFQVGGQGTRPTFFEMSAAQQLPSSLRAALTYSFGVSNLLLLQTPPTGLLRFSSNSSFFLFFFLFQFIY